MSPLFREGDDLFSAPNVIAREGGIGARLA
jgi:hypothetical protein